MAAVQPPHFNGKPHSEMCSGSSSEQVFSVQSPAFQMYPHNINFEILEFVFVFDLCGTSDRPAPYITCILPLLYATPTLVHLECHSVAIPAEIQILFVDTTLSPFLDSYSQCFRLAQPSKNRLRSCHVSLLVD